MQRLAFFLPVLALIGCGRREVSKEVYYDQTKEIEALQQRVVELEELLALPWWMQIPPEDVIAVAATACAALGALLFALSFVALWFVGRKTFMTMIVIGMGLMAMSPILAFVSAYLMWIGLLVAAGIGYLIWNRIEWIEELLGIDLNRDGRIGRGRVAKRAKGKMGTFAKWKSEKRGG